MSTWCPKIIQFLFTFPLWGYIVLCFSMLNRRVTTGVRWNKIKISPNNLRANICHCSSSLCSWHHLRISVWTHLGMTETDSNQGSPSRRNNCKSDREWVYLLLCFFGLHKAIWELHWDGYGNMTTVNSAYWEKSLTLLIAPNQYMKLSWQYTHTISGILPLDISKSNKTNTFW